MLFWIGTKYYYCGNPKSIELTDKLHEKLEKLKTSIRLQGKANRYQERISKPIRKILFCYLRWYLWLIILSNAESFLEISVDTTFQCQLTENTLFTRRSKWSCYTGRDWRALHHLWVYGKLDLTNRYRWWSYWPNRSATSKRFSSSECFFQQPVLLIKFS